MQNQSKEHKLKLYGIKETFGIAEASDKAMVLGLEPGLPGVPEVDPYYVFETERLRDLTMFWVAQFGAMLIEGDPSAGKTSLVKEWHARLNVPLDIVPCSPSTEARDLIGSLLPVKDGTLEWFDGPIARAYRNGTSVLLDEYNLVDPGQASGLNAALEKYPISIPQTGEVLIPKATTRVFATQNPVDSLAAVAGRNTQDVANEDRFFTMEVDFLKPDVETALVARVLGEAIKNQDLADQIARVTVAVANKVRQAFRSGDAAIEKPMSTRAVLRWAKLTAMYRVPMEKKGVSSLHYSVTRALKMPATMAAAVKQIITAESGVTEHAAGAV